MLGMALRNASSLFHGSSLRKRMTYIKCCAAPYFHTEGLRKGYGKPPRRFHHIPGAHARCQQALVCVAHRGIGIVYFLFLLQPFAESFDPVLSAGLWCLSLCRYVYQRQALRVFQMSWQCPHILRRGCRSQSLPPGIEHLCAPVLPEGVGEQFRVFLYKVYGRFTGNKVLMRDQIFEELDIIFYASYAEFP